MIRRTSAIGIENRALQTPWNVCEIDAPGEYSAVPVDEVPLPDILDDPEAALLRRERAGQLQQAIAALGERCRKIFPLRMESLGFSEMATRLGAGSINTMYTWDSRCRQQLMERLNHGDKKRA